MLIPGRKRVPREVREQWKAAKHRTRLSIVRRAQGVRQEDLAKAAGISLATLQRLESGAMGSGVQVGQLLRCAAALNVPFTMLIDTAWIEAAEELSPAPRRLHGLRWTKVELPPDD